MLNGIGFFLFMLTLIARGPAGNADLLDMVSTESYWKAKNIAPSIEQLQKDAGPDAAPQNPNQLIKDLASDDFKTRDAAKKQLEAMGADAAPALKPLLDSKDPEAVAIATEIQKNIAAKKKDRSIRRLMAIRTLGETTQKANIPFLKTLADSKEPFVADYANRSIAQIEGRKLPRVNHQKILAADLALIPKDAGIIGQASDLTGLALSLDKVAETVAEQSNDQNRFGHGVAKMDKAQALAYLTEQPLKFAESIGNLRCDGVTLAVSDQIGPQGGWFMLSFHGQYDAQALLEAIKTTASVNRFPGDTRPAPKLSHEGKVDILDIENSVIICPSNDHLIMVVAHPRNGRPAMVDTIVAVLNGGKGEFDQNKDMNDLMKTVDLTAPAWVVGKVSDAVKREKIFGAFDTFTAIGRQPKENLEVTVTGTGADAALVKGATEEVTTGLAGLIPMIKAQVEKNKGFEPLADMFESVKITPNDKSATMTGEIKPTILYTMLAESGLVWMISSEQRRANPGVNNAPMTMPGE